MWVPKACLATSLAVFGMLSNVLGMLGNVLDRPWHAYSTFVKKVL